MGKPDDLRLVAIDRESEASLKRFYDPKLAPFALIVCKNNKVIRIPYQFSLGPVGWTIAAIEQHLEPMKIQIRK